MTEELKTEKLPGEGELNQTANLFIEYSAKFISLCLKNRGLINENNIFSGKIGKFYFSAWISVGKEKIVDYTSFNSWSLKINGVEYERFSHKFIFHYNETSNEDTFEAIIDAINHAKYLIDNFESLFKNKKRKLKI